VPYPQNVYYVAVRIYLIDEPVWLKYRFTNRLFGFFGNDSVGKWQLRCGLKTLYNSISKFGGCIRIVQSYILYDSFEVFN